MGTYDKIETDNPLLDELVYAAKKLMVSTILKDEAKANEIETISSRHNFQIYERIMMKFDTFHHYTYTYDDYKKLPFTISDNTITRYLQNMNLVPENIRKELSAMKNAQFLKEHTTEDGKYIDDNEYYRDLSGIPGSKYAYVYLSDDDYEMLNMKFDYKSTPVHMLNITIRKSLGILGIKDKLYNQYQYEYLKHIDKDLSAYTMRKQYNFALLYADNTGIDSSVYNNYLLFIERNRVYVKANADFAVLKLYSDYYDKILGMMIIIQAIIDLIGSYTDYQITKDFFDLRTIRLYMESNAIPFFTEIPLKYQQRIVKNLNKLIQNKATDQDFIYIMNIFNIENIDLYKYYLCKQNQFDENGMYKNTGNPAEDYSLKFLKVNIKDSPITASKDPSNYEEYNNIVDNDKTWNGPYEKEEVYDQLLHKDFNIEPTKYISINAVYSMSDVSFQMAYFLNMLKFSKVAKSNINVKLDCVNSGRNFNLVNVIYFITALSNHYYDIEDRIIYTQSTCLTIRGFNFDVNLQEILKDINKNGTEYTLKDLGVDKFSGGDNCSTIDDVIKLFLNNSEVYEHISYQMQHAKSKKMYDIYSQLYDALMVTTLNTDHFYLDERLDEDGHSAPGYAETYTEYLKYNDEFLYETIKSFDSIEDEAERKKAIANMLSSASSEILIEINEDKLSQIFSNLPSDVGNFAKNYIINLINTFKSYTVNLLEFKSVYHIDKDNKVNVLSDLAYHTWHEIADAVNVIDKMSRIDILSKDDKVNVADSTKLSVFHKFQDICDLKEEFGRNVVFNKSDNVIIDEELMMMRIFFREYGDYVLVNDYFAEINRILYKTDEVVLHDVLLCKPFYAET